MQSLIMQNIYVVLLVAYLSSNTYNPVVIC